MAIEPVTREERFLAAAGGRSVTPPTPITRKEQLLQGIIDAVKSGGATPDVIEGAVNDYLNANPVQPGATEEQEAQIEKNKTDIADLQEEIKEKQPKGDYVKTVNGNKPDASGNVVVEVPEGSGGYQLLTSFTLEEDVREFAIDLPDAIDDMMIQFKVLAAEGNSGSGEFRIYFNTNYNNEMYRYKNGIYIGVALTGYFSRTFKPGWFEPILDGRRYTAELFEVQTTNHEFWETINRVVFYSPSDTILFGRGTIAQIYRRTS